MLFTRSKRPIHQARTAFTEYRPPSPLRRCNPCLSFRGSGARRKPAVKAAAALSRLDSQSAGMSPPVLSEAEHFIRCPQCGAWFDMRDLGQVTTTRARYRIRPYRGLRGADRASDAPF